MTKYTTRERLIGAAERHKSLSKKSLVRVWAWAKGNPGNPLAEAYMNACVCCGALDSTGISDELEKSWRGKDGARGIWLEILRISDSAFFNRDVVGRIILDKLNREEG